MGKTQSEWSESSEQSPPPTRRHMIRAANGYIIEKTQGAASAPQSAGEETEEKAF